MTTARVQKNEYELIDYIDELVSILFKRWGIIVSTSCIVFAAVAAATFLVTPIYEATSSLLVKFGREFIYSPEVGNLPPLSVFNKEEEVNSAVSILGSKEITNKVFDVIDEKSFYPDIQPTAENSALNLAQERFRRNFAVEPVKKSSVINLSFRHKNPEMAVKALDTLMRLFIARHLELHSRSSSDFFEKQLELFRTELDAAEERLEEFKQTNRISSLEEQRSLLLKQRSDLDTAFKTAQSLTYEFEKKFQSFSKQTSILMQSSDNYTQSELERTLVESRSKLLSLKLEEKELSSKFNSDSPLLVTIREQIKVIEQFLQDEERAIATKVKSANPAYQFAERQANLAGTEIEALQTRLETLQAQIKTLDDEIKALDLQEKQLGKLRRDVVIAEQNFKVYQTKLEESRIQDEMNRQKIANISIVQSAVASAKPISPKKAINLSVGLILALVTGFGLALLREFGSQSFATSRSLEHRLNVPVLSIIPRFPARLIKKAA